MSSKFFKPFTVRQAPSSSNSKKIAKRAAKAERQAEMTARAAATSPAIEFAAPCSAEEFFAPLPSSAEAFRAKTR